MSFIPPSSPVQVIRKRDNLLIGRPCQLAGIGRDLLGVRQWEHFCTRQFLHSAMAVTLMRHYAGERFVVLSKNGSRSEEDEVDSILESFYGSSMLRTSPNWPKPRASSTSGYSAFQPRYAVSSSLSMSCRLNRSWPGLSCE